MVLVVVMIIMIMILTTAMTTRQMITETAIVPANKHTHSPQKKESTNEYDCHSSTSNQSRIILMRS